MHKIKALDGRSEEVSRERGLNRSMMMVVWSNWEREREREGWKSKTKRWVKPILFLFKFLTSRISFYGLVNVEPELELKVEFLTLTNLHSTCLGIWVGQVWWVDGQPYFIYNSFIYSMHNVTSQKNVISLSLNFLVDFVFLFFLHLCFRLINFCIL